MAVQLSKPLQCFLDLLHVNASWVPVWDLGGGLFRVFGLLKRIRSTHTYSLAMDPGVHQQLDEVPV